VSRDVPGCPWTPAGRGATVKRAVALALAQPLSGLALERVARVQERRLGGRDWPGARSMHRLLELAPAYWKKTLEQSDAQQRLDDNVFRKVALGLPLS
jgi:hypothetical protein